MTDAVVQLRGLTKTFPGGTRALQALTLTLGKGELLGIVGPDGAGKTTLLRILAGVLSFDQGQVQLFGQDLKVGQNQMRQRVGYIPQRFSLYEDLTVRENLDFFAGVYPVPQQDRRTRKELLEFIGLAPFQDRLAGALSGGMKQKLALLCSLVSGPELLLMDEPTVGVDPVSRREFWSLVFELQKEGVTVLASTPYMDEAEQFDRVALLDQGQFLRMGTTDEIKSSVAGKVIEIYCQAPVRARALLLGLSGVEDVELFGDRIHVFVSDHYDAILKTIREVLLQADLQVGEAEFCPYSIEDVFLKLSRKEALA